MGKKLERLLTVAEAADRLGILKDVLTRLIDDGTMIKASITDKGEVLVPISEIGKITRERFKKLRGNPITVTEAVKKYEVPYTTLIGWVHSPLGLITIIKPGYGMQLDEADVAYCAAVYRARGRSSRLFDKAGRPYQLQNPELAEYRRRRARQAQEASA